MTFVCRICGWVPAEKEEYCPICGFVLLRPPDRKPPPPPSKTTPKKENDPIPNDSKVNGEGDASIASAPPSTSTSTSLSTRTPPPPKRAPPPPPSKSPLQKPNELTDTATSPATTPSIADAKRQLESIPFRLPAAHPTASISESASTATPCVSTTVDIDPLQVLREERRARAEQLAEQERQMKAIEAASKPKEEEPLPHAPIVNVSSQIRRSSELEKVRQMKQDIETSIKVTSTPPTPPTATTPAPITLAFGSIASHGVTNVSPSITSSTISTPVKVTNPTSTNTSPVITDTAAVTASTPTKPPSHVPAATTPSNPEVTSIATALNTLNIASHTSSSTSASSFHPSSSHLAAPLPSTSRSPSASPARSSPSSPSLSPRLHFPSESEKSHEVEMKIRKRLDDAVRWVDKEIRKLIATIIQVHQSKNASLPDTIPTVTFGELFLATENTMEALSGTLKTAKKRQVVSYDGDLLLQRVHDHVRITLLKSEIEDSLLPDHSKRDMPVAKKGGFEVSTGGMDTCAVCGHVVYLAERVASAKHVYHTTCFTCTHCHTMLDPHTYCNINDKNYCRRDYDMLVKTKGTNF